ncbi:hypothetical protein [uncultured Sulfitobacter sp.]|uniref:hypothetical protein n=1 Tax=uncultured Sulfitobacter sp. TaxID=191468 RepID=UPI0025931100|nr:hypothetical protein [uncultured Sulfitobacter sp.]
MFFTISGCANEPGSLNDIHTGTSAGHSKSYNAASGLLYNLNSSAIVAVRGNETKYAVSTRFLSTGMGWSFFREAWSFGQQMEFNVTNETVASCGSGTCSHIEDGAIVMTRAQFEKAAQTGFEFKLVGKNRSVIGKLPAEAFKEALAFFP